MRKGKAAKFKKKKRKGQLIAIGVIAALAIGLGFGLYNYMQHPPRSAGFGAIGSAHEHAAFKLFINNEEPVDFSLPQYQVTTRFIHFEDKNGVITHRHASGVDLGFLFESLGMNFDEKCITLNNATSYCSEADQTLNFFVNGTRNDKYDKYILNDGDRILLSFGSESEEQIKDQLNALDLIPVPKDQQ